MGTHRIINVFNVSLSIFVSKIRATKRERDKACNNEGRILLKNVHCIIDRRFVFEKMFITRPTNMIGIYFQLNRGFNLYLPKIISTLASL